LKEYPSISKKKFACRFILWAFMTNHREKPGSCLAISHLEKLFSGEGELEEKRELTGFTG
jgi:hypothetical protein